MAAYILELTDADFDRKVKESTLPMVVDFWAPWCGPCKMIAPVMAELAAEYRDRLTVAKMDIAQHPETAVKYGIKSIPALLFFREGQVSATIVGAAAKKKIQGKIEEVIAG